MNMQPTDVVRNFFARWQVSREALMRSFGEFMADDCIWVNVGVATTTGPNEAEALMNAFTLKVPFDTIRVEFLGICADGNKVFTERVDYMIDAEGRQFGEVPVAGVFDIADGRIHGWRDYFAPTPG